jgi:hypothetical protein
MLHLAEKITRQQCRRKVTLRCACVTLLPWKAISITYVECVFVALGIQHAKGMHSIKSSVAYPAVVYISTLSHNGIVCGT